MVAVVVVPRSRQAPGLLREGSLKGALVRRLRVRTAAHLRVSTSASVVSSSKEEEGHAGATVPTLE